MLGYSKSGYNKSAAADHATIRAALERIAVSRSTKEIAFVTT